MDDVLRAFRCREPEERIPVLQLELDYELALLYEAMCENNERQKEKSIKRLQKLRQELVILEAWSFVTSDNL